MPIPTKPLIIMGENGVPFDFEDLYITETVLFEQGGFSRDAVIRFLRKHSNWTKYDIEKIKEKELMAVWSQLVDKVNAATTPPTK